MDSSTDQSHSTSLDKDLFSDTRSQLILVHWLSSLKNDLISGTFSNEDLFETKDQSVEEARKSFEQIVESLLLKVENIRSDFPDLYYALNGNLSDTASQIVNFEVDINLLKKIPIRDELKSSLIEALSVVRKWATPGEWSLESLVNHLKEQQVDLRFQAACCKLPKEADKNSRLDQDRQETRLPTLPLELPKADEQIAAALEAGRKECLYLGLRNNRHLNYSTSTRGHRGLAIVEGEERSSDIYNILVKQEKSLSFNSIPDPEIDSDDRIEKQPKENEKDLSSFTDLQLNTIYDDHMLQRRLRKTAREARVYQEDHGENGLYIALGFFHWKEASHYGDSRRAPLVKIPVKITQRSATERFYLNYSGGEIEWNETLQVKLEEEFKFRIPQYDQEEVEDAVEYIQRVEQALAQHLKGFEEKKPYLRIEPDEMSIDIWPAGDLALKRDLDETRWPEDKKPQDNRLLRALFGNGFSPLPVPWPEEGLLDPHVDISDLYTIEDYDSSQLMVLLSSEINDLDVEGPPGAGKTKTLRNLIAHLVAQGKTVGITSEKLVALRQIKKGLEEKGLGSTCLELHSDSLTRRAFVQQFKELLDLRAPIVNNDRDDVLKNVTETRYAINRYRKVLGEVIPNRELNVYEAIGKASKYSAATGVRNNLGFRHMRYWNQEKYQGKIDQVSEIEKMFKKHGLPWQNPFWGSQLTTWDEKTRQNVTKQIDSLLSIAVELESSGDDFKKLLSKQDVVDRVCLNALNEAYDFLQLPPNIDGIHLDKELDWTADSEKLKRILKIAEDYQEIIFKVDKKFVSEAWTADLSKVRAELHSLNSYLGVVNPFSWYSYLNTRSSLKRLYSGSVPIFKSALLRDLDTIIDSQILKNQIEQDSKILNKYYINPVTIPGTNIKELFEATRWAARFNKNIRQHDFYPRLLDLASSLPLNREVESLFVQTRKNIRDYQIAIFTLAKTLHCDISELEDKFLTSSLENNRNTLEELGNSIPKLISLVRYNQSRRDAERDDLDFLFSYCEGWDNVDSKLVDSYKATWYKGIADEAAEYFPEIEEFNRETHEKNISDYNKAEQELLHCNVDEIASRAFLRLPKSYAGGKLADFKKEITRHSGHQSPRQNFEDYASIIHDCKQVILMNPRVASKILPAGKFHFDVLIVEEASQVKPLHVVPLALRADKILGSGDRKQLGPQTLFEGVDDRVTDDVHSKTASKENVLEFLSTQGAQTTMLEGHYRSRHESNIAVSNILMYNQKLRVFPSPWRKKEGLGLHYRYVEDAVYGRGNAKNNPIEAQAIVDAVVEHVKTKPERSLLIGTFSIAQMETVEDLLEEVRRSDKDFQIFEKLHPREQPVVVNLENVQGDERDDVYLSLGYGFHQPVGEADRKLYKNFGQINHSTLGPRRLNTLFTRARLSTTLFGNFRHEDLGDVSELSPGLAMLHSIIKYGETGELDLQKNTVSRKPSELEEYISNELIKRGFEVELHVGDLGGRVNIAVCNPSDPEERILGILLDDVEYQETRSARDQDRIKVHMLEELGWKIHRTWAAEVLSDPKVAITRIEDSLKRILSGATYTPLSQITKKSLYIPARDTSTDAPLQEIVAEPYEKAIIDNPPQSIVNTSSHFIERAVKTIVDVEHPVHVHVIQRRVKDLFQVKRISANMERMIEMALLNLSTQNYLSVNSSFAYKNGKDDISVRNRDEYRELKRFEFIPSEEVLAALELVVRHSYGIQPKDMAEAVSKIFGFRSAASGSQHAVDIALEKALSQKLFVETEGYVFLSNLIQ